MIAIYLLLISTVVFIKNQDHFNTTGLLSFLGVVGLYIFSMLMVNKIAHDNELTFQNSYTILLYAFLTGVVLPAILDFHSMAANFFIILGVHEIAWINQNRNHKYLRAKILNASLSIAIASLFYFWSLLFYGVIYLAIFYFASKNYRNWFVPLVGYICVFFLTTCAHLLVWDTFYIPNEINEGIFFVANFTLTEKEWTALIVLLGTVILLLLVHFMKLKRKPSKNKPLYKVLIFYIIIALIITITSSPQNISKSFLIAAPLSILGTTYLESSYAPWIKETSIGLLLLIPIFLVF